MTIRAPQYLYLYTAFPVSITGLGTGKTVTAKFSATREGNPSAIGSLTVTLTETGSTGNYTGTFARADLLSELGSTYVNKPVYLHIDDGVVFHDVWPFRATDVDPDLLSPLAA